MIYTPINGNGSHVYSNTGDVVASFYTEATDKHEHESANERAKLKSDSPKGGICSCSEALFLS